MVQTHSYNEMRLTWVLRRGGCSWRRLQDFQYTTLPSQCVCLPPGPCARLLQSAGLAVLPPYPPSRFLGLSAASGRVRLPSATASVLALLPLLCRVASSSFSPLLPRCPASRWCFRGGVCVSLCFCPSCSALRGLPSAHAPYLPFSYHAVLTPPV